MSMQGNAKLIVSFPIGVHLYPLTPSIEQGLPQDRGLSSYDISS